MASKTDIFNGAIRLVGARRIENADDNATRAARELTDAWEDVRKEFLTLHPWNFAKVYTTLAATVNTPDWKWSYEFLLPGDCLQVRQVGEYARTPYENVSDRRLYANQDTLKISYTQDVQDTALYHPTFVSALQARLAVEIVEAVTQSSTKKADLEAVFDKRLRRAKRVDMKNAPPQESRCVTLCVTIRTARGAQQCQATPPTNSPALSRMYCGTSGWSVLWS